MIPTVVMATTLLISPGLPWAPFDGRVYVLSQDDRWGAYLSAPDQTAPNVRTAWSWSVWLTRDGSLLIDAFLNEYDCDTSQFRRVRQERFREDGLYDTRVSEGGFRSPHWLDMEGRLTEEVCRDTYLTLPQTENIHAAVAELTSGRSSS
ncbi:MAG: hypothetical protein KKF15_14580 [Alphaproteobacteria bacterium]|nr:hypothetical protein [Alphaproteobacteria bacterium]MBU1258973.1 hypothetical protein [Alphaproteobacteria bacterium]MBU1463713.1 hypothetical protein [Alphaproteobacteria bacterium]MBU1795821.1 hypothetical protein [Alphaproteobacteria bacterium]